MAMTTTCPRCQHQSDGLHQLCATCRYVCKRCDRPKRTMMQWMATPSTYDYCICGMSETLMGIALP